MSERSVASGKPPLAVRIETEKSHPLRWKAVAERVAVVAVEAAGPQRGRVQRQRVPSVLTSIDYCLSSTSKCGSVSAAKDHTLAVCRSAIASYARSSLDSAVKRNAPRCGGSLGFDLVLACRFAAMESLRPASRNCVLKSGPVINYDGVRVAEGSRPLK